MVEGVDLVSLSLQSPAWGPGPGARSEVITPQLPGTAATADKWCPGRRTPGERLQRSSCRAAPTSSSVWALISRIRGGLASGHPLKE
ncbi:unnamed protein product [Gadus morhua 'NCC']